MGAQNALNGLVGTIGVGATMLSRNLGKGVGQQAGQKQQGQSQANNAQLNQQAYQKSMQNMVDLQVLKKNINGIWKDKTLTERQKVLRSNKALGEIEGGKK